VATALAVAALGLAGAVVPPPAPAHAADELTFVGHGWGHGRGMGQYGALGYAVNHGWSHAQILDHFYGGTVMGNVGNPQISVELIGWNGRPLVAVGRGLVVNGAVRPDADAGGSAVRVTRQGDGSFLVEAAAGCAGPTWTPIGTYPTEVNLTASRGGFEGMVRTCEAGGERGYRGSLSVLRYADTGPSLTVNRVALEDYLRGVVPRESPASWGSLGGGRGMQALMAQSVAARSYAFSGSRPSGATTCDTTTCQVYGGATFQAPGRGLEVLDAANTNQAIDLTRGQVRMATGTTRVVRTEFSSSTGGYTAGPTFPPVPDLGDAISLNPNHTWSDTRTLDAIAAGLGTGPIRSIAVTARNGLGAEGGRVTNLRVITTAGQTVNFTGNEVRSRLGLKSDWFSLSGIIRSEAERVVRALYQDVLGRGPDPSGLQSWTNAVLATGDPQVVTRGIVYSRERLAALVAREYQGALHRAPEPGGVLAWTHVLEAGAGVSDFQVGVYASAESLQTLGGGDTRTWVGAMYAALLGRAAVPAEQDLWAQVARTHGREAAVAGIAKSQEAGQRRLAGYYQTFLGRGLDANGVASFLPYMSGAGDFLVPGFIGGSAEYWARSQTRFP
jgi:SpoIID/LytB domain protein